MPKMGGSKHEKEFLSRIRKYPSEIIMDHKDSVQEGFEYFASEEYTSKEGSVDGGLFTKLTSGGVKGFFKLASMMGKNMKGLMGEMKRNYTDTEEYVSAIERDDSMHGTETAFMQPRPNYAIWEKLKDFAWTKFGIILGFTEVPKQFVFKGKAVLFPYALVCIQEMDKDKIDRAPDMDAGVEVMRVYNTLGKATNDIAAWLREEHGIACMANHPLGGLVDTLPLAEKAGLGRMGRSGLLITPKFGKRHRVAPIFIDNPVFKFTDNSDHRWLEEFCMGCGKCVQNCPQGAIYAERREYIRYDDRYRNRVMSIDREKCFPFFSKTMGCSVCIKVCPFSKGGDTYEKLKRAHLKKKDSAVSNAQ